MLLYNKNRQIIKYTTIFKEHETIILPKGTVLYHGTGVKFNPKEIRPGRYDYVLWTSLSKKIASYYIPVSNFTTILDLNYIDILNNNVKTKKQLESIGLDKKTYFALLVKGQVELKKKYDLKDELEHYKKLSNDDEYMDTLSTDEIESFFKTWYEKEDTYKKMLDIDEQKYIKNFIKSAIEKLGYTFNREETKIKIDSEYKILPSDYREEGNIIKMKLNRPFTFRDHRKSLEGDIMDVEYHDVSDFQKYDKESYDGVIINDFAQSEKFGNTEHISYGLFGKVLKEDIQIVDVIKAYHAVD